MSNQEDRDRGAADRQAADLDQKRALRRALLLVLDAPLDVHDLTVADVLLGLAREALDRYDVAEGDADGRTLRHNAKADIGNARWGLGRLRQRAGLAS